MAAALAEQMNSGIWFDRAKVEEAEEKYQEYLVKKDSPSPKSNSKKVVSSGGGNVAQQIAQARQQIHDTLQSTSTTSAPVSLDLESLQNSVNQLTQENRDLKAIVTKLHGHLQRLESRLSAVEGKGQPTKQAPKSEPVKDEDSDSDDDGDLFGSTDEEEDAAYEKLKEERIAAYKDKKSKKSAVVAKSTIIMDVKPWDDETNIDELEKCVRSIQTEGLLWGASKRIPVAYGIIKLQISCVVVDDLVGTDYLEEEILKNEDYIQSMDVVAFNKI